ncbi:protein FAM151A isoform X1 [Rhynchophorus ferrugineus]|uniref:protein FAM151A isoform X1 n=2 Tax=Rhynchophorus ferrugineus TaxID=354439 RepID=UPI003FCE723D
MLHSCKRSIKAKMTKHIHKKSLLFYWASIILAVATADMEDFFPNIKGNLTKISWAHAVNNQSHLAAVLNDSAIMMIEADVRVGTVGNDTSVIPIMAHDGNTSDLALSDFLSKVAEFNQLHSNETDRKGVKLDFKLIDAFRKSAHILTEYFNNAAFPIWLNADILKGESSNNESLPEPVNATEFLKLANDNFPNATLSLGWTTTGDINFPYTKNQTESMISQLHAYNFTSITFPVRAVLAAKSVDILADLVSSYQKSTITIWSAVNDKDIDIEGLRSLIRKVGLKKTYIDVPDSLLSQLHLNTINGVGKTIRLSCITVIVITLFSVLLNM